ncbi:hypothetical protein RCL1_007135 [Eukaryota sp. TZLM3-RCL]
MGKCQFCEVLEATYDCRDCDVSYCFQCSQFVHSAPSKSKHSLFPVSETPTVVCDQCSRDVYDQSKPAVSYCSTCKMNLCSQCVASHHEECPQRFLFSISDSVRSKTTPLTESPPVDRKVRINLLPESAITASCNAFYVQWDSTIKHTGVLNQRHVRVMWSVPPKSVMIVLRLNDRIAIDVCFDVVSFLLSKSVEIYVEKYLSTSRLNEIGGLNFIDEHGLQSILIDFVVTIGGDGTVIHGVQLFKAAVPPFIPINLGSLGFLTPFVVQDTEGIISHVLNGEFMTTIRHTVETFVLTPLSASSDPQISSLCSSTYLALNEVSIERSRSTWVSTSGPGNRLGEQRPLLRCYCDDQLLFSVVSDGILVATTTGSTAYSLAAGGSCVHPTLPALLITPICASSQCWRPLILPASCTVSVEIVSSADDILSVCFDGRNCLELKEGDKVITKVSPFPVPTVCKTTQTQDWLESLKNSLSWNKRLVQKPL